MPGRKPLEPEKVIDLVIRKGISTSCVAERLGCRRDSVAAVLKKNGYEFQQFNKTWLRVSSGDTRIMR